MITPDKIIRDHAEEGARLRAAFLTAQAGRIDAAARLMARSLAAGGRILICGNGGSAADAQLLYGFPSI